MKVLALVFFLSTHSLAASVGDLTTFINSTNGDTRKVFKGHDENPSSCLVWLFFPAGANGPAASNGDTTTITGGPILQMVMHPAVINITIPKTLENDRQSWEVSVPEVGVYRGSLSFSDGKFVATQPFNNSFSATESYTFDVVNKSISYQSPTKSCAYTYGDLDSTPERAVDDSTLRAPSKESIVAPANGGSSSSSVPR